MWPTITAAGAARRRTEGELGPPGWVARPQVAHEKVRRREKGDERHEKPRRDEGDEHEGDQEGGWGDEQEDKE